MEKHSMRHLKQNIDNNRTPSHLRNNANAPTTVFVRTVKVMAFSMQINKIKHSAPGPLLCSKGTDIKASNKETPRFVATQSKNQLVSTVQLPAVLRKSARHSSPSS